ncbi:hypothetical protein Cus16_0763 [Curtobacterium sp. ER1/6]|nr:hypothetical protein Cus16_0763 [Curtobacterium sp. ER1/6]
MLGPGQRLRRRAGRCRGVRGAGRRGPRLRDGDGRVRAATGAASVGVARRARRHRGTGRRVLGGPAARRQRRAARCLTGVLLHSPTAEGVGPQPGAGVLGGGCVGAMLGA